MGYSKIIAMDLGKFKTVGCVMDVATRTHAFETGAGSIRKSFAGRRSGSFSLIWRSSAGSVPPAKTRR